MKCILDKATDTIERVSDNDAAFYVGDKSHRYSYISKSEWKAQLLAKKDVREQLQKSVRKSRHNRRKAGEFR